MRTWDPRYTRLQESGDPAKCLFRAVWSRLKYGKGTYTYTGLRLFPRGSLQV
jgi:hypothetical protein